MNTVHKEKEFESLSLSIDGETDLLPKLKGFHTKEVVIGLCGAIGSPTRDVALRLETLLKELYSYDPKIIKLSEKISQLPTPAETNESGFARYTQLIDRGNKLREQFGDSILAELAIADISIKRESLRSDSKNSNRFCHIIDSIKNEQELKTFREVYGNLFICIGVYASIDERERCLAGRGLKAEEIQKLIMRDSGKEKHGPTVGDTFHQADFFIATGSDGVKGIDEKLKRITELVFGTKVVTPTKDETAMYSAFTASLNSACLSRQVGAAVTDKDGTILGLGWNDVPRFRGGLYDSNSPQDFRCYNFNQKCHNDEEKAFIAEELTKILKENNLIPSNKEAAVIKCIQESRLKGLIEFSRAVHAEMLALLNAAKNGGKRIDGGSIYVTTYPCHSCARHIVAAGLFKVYYIEPYRKSLATTLHSDSISEGTISTDKVQLVPFEGVSPSRYADFFKMPAGGRKKFGKLIELSPKTASFRTEASLKSLSVLERMVFKKLVEDDKLIVVEEPKK